MKQRVLTGILAGVPFLTIVVIGNIPFVILVYILATIGLYEILKMKKISLLSVPGFLSLIFLWLFLNPFPVEYFSKVEVTLLLVFLLLTMIVLTKNKVSFDDVSFILLSTLYISIGFYYLIETRMAGLSYLFFVLFIIWATDSGAYFIGKSIGKRKLWPLISPNKTIEGSIGGIGCAIITAIVFQLFIPIHESLSVIIFIAILTSIFGQIGDLVESAIKRHYIVKDSGHLLPGHGGILDRFDSLMFVLPMLHFLHLF